MKKVLILLMDLLWARTLHESSVHPLFSDLLQQGVAS